MSKMNWDKSKKMKRGSVSLKEVAERWDRTDRWLAKRDKNWKKKKK